MFKMFLILRSTEHKPRITPTTPGTIIKQEVGEKNNFLKDVSKGLCAPWYNCYTIIEISYIIHTSQSGKKYDNLILPAITKDNTKKPPRICMEWL